MQNNSSHLGELVAVFTALSWSIGMFPFTEAAKRLGPNALNLFRLILAVILLSIATVLFTDISWTNLYTSANVYHWGWLGISGVIGLALGDYFGFSSFTTIGTRLSSVFNTLAPAAALIFGFFINDDRINIIGITGMLITIGGIIWLTLSKSEKQRVAHLHPSDYRKGIIFAILASLCQGVGVVLSQRGLNYKIGNQSINPIHASLIRMIAATAGVIVIAAFTGRLKHTLLPAFQNKNKGIGYAIAGTMFGPFIGMALSMQAVSLTSASVAQTVFSLVPVFVLLLAHFFYKERITAKSLLGAIIAIIGVIILVWRDAIFHNLFS